MSDLRQPLSDLRRPIDPVAVTNLLHRPGRFEVRAVRSTGSTNDDLAKGQPAGRLFRVLTAEQQVTGRGRAGRTWSCPPGGGLMFSVRLSAGRIPADRRGWTGAALGVAVTRALATVHQVEAGLKWPNDVLVDGRKCAGILADLVGGDVVVGAGLNISLREEELPRPDATSLVLSGVRSPDRSVLLAEILNGFSDLLDRWSACRGDVDESGLRAAYLQVCATLGQRVRIELPGDRFEFGRVIDVEAGGAVVIIGEDGRASRYLAGDVVHLRPAER